MLVPTDIPRFAQVCSAIANEVASSDESGFVAIERLVDRVGATLILRPLLVEGMLASFPGDSATPDKKRWAVLIDNETYPITSAELKRESFAKPLHVRFRNTVAHELVHLLAFRANEFGVPCQDVNELKGRHDEIVDQIEKDTERLSPLLLWPERSIEKHIGSKTTSIAIKDLVNISRGMGISRPVLISRLNLIPDSDPFRFKHTSALKNVAIGLGEWIDRRVASFRKLPLFINFDRNVVPSFLLRLRKQERLSASEVIQDHNFGMCGGWVGSTRLECRAGVPDAIDATSMHIEISMEWVERSAGNTFFFVVRKQPAQI